MHKVQLWVTAGLSGILAYFPSALVMFGCVWKHACCLSVLRRNFASSNPAQMLFLVETIIKASAIICFERTHTLTKQHYIKNGVGK